MAKARLNPREMMERAVEVMRQSVKEDRSDGSPSPQVGAVLIRPDGSIETAARGELRDGEHAEFTLLEHLASRTSRAIIARKRAIPCGAIAIAQPIAQSLRDAAVLI